MKGMILMIIDFHTHCFPDKIAEMAIKSISAKGGGAKAYTDGTLRGLKKRGNDADVDFFVVLNIATNPNQQTKVNDFAASINGGRIFSFGSVHPLAENALDELDRIKELGLKGIKLHPDYQEFFVDDEKFFPLYEKAAKLGLITVFHSGVDYGLFEPVHCTPERLSKALPAFNGGVVVAAHFGGYFCWYDVEEYLVGKQIYFDTSFCYGRIPIQHAKRIVKNHGADKILFGSDLPWSKASSEIMLVKGFELPEDEYEMVIGKNAAKLLGIINF